jgi:hypothetical protein
MRHPRRLVAVMIEALIGRAKVSSHCGLLDLNVIDYRAHSRGACLIQKWRIATSLKE